MNGSNCLRLVWKISLLVFFLHGFPVQASSQELSIAYSDYLKAIGMEDDYIVMKNILRGGLIDRVEDRPAGYYEDNAEFFSMVLLLSDIKPVDYYKLEQNGIDVIHAITADIRPFDEQSLLADLAIIGGVVKVQEESSEQDGFDKTMYVQISDVLKGSAPSDTIQIRRRSSSRQSGDQIQPELNRTYLFLLSSGMYGYHKANYQFRQKNEVVVSPPAFGKEEVFLIYRIYPYINGELYYSPQNTTAAFNSLQLVDFLLKQD